MYYTMLMKYCCNHHRFSKKREIILKCLPYFLFLLFRQNICADTVQFEQLCEVGFIRAEFVFYLLYPLLQSRPLTTVGRGDTRLYSCHVLLDNKHTVNDVILVGRDARISTKLGQIGTKRNKFGTFKENFSVHVVLPSQNLLKYYLKKSRINPL